MEDPLVFLARECPWQPDRILATVKGTVYFGMMLSDGRVGVAATLGNTLESDPQKLRQPDLTRADERIYQLAYSNACLNYDLEGSEEGDIFDRVSFQGEAPTVMVGYFPPLVKKFRDSGLPLRAFDLHKEYEDAESMERLPEAISQAGRLILTATSLINGSAMEVMGQAPAAAPRYLLGPSTPLSKSFAEKYGFTALFGMVFEPYEFAVLDAIGQGLGTKSFSAFGKKVLIKR